MTSSPPHDGPELIKAVPARHPGRWVATAVVAVLLAMFVHMLVTNDAFQWGFMFDNAFRPAVLKGVRVTLLMTVSSMFFGVLIGILVAVMVLSDNPLLKAVGWGYTWIFRAIPRMVLLFTVGNLGVLYRTIDVGGVPFDWLLSDLTGIPLDGHLFGLDANTLFVGIPAGIIGLSLSEGAYMAEIVRAGISSVERGQTEAAAALGMTQVLAMRRIVLPQALRIIVPPTGNEAIAMLKDTSLVFVLPVTTELFFQLSAIGSRTFQPVPMYVAACLWYLAMSSVLMIGQYFLERRFGRGFERTGERRRPRIMGGMGGA